ncbi:unannotated protein [freshwater metagenome]|uniref:Unannotated protein n=1 Tax=freshwater metagenome TaxID=449393 RepID=A0A6J7ENR5_9ZZZZ
MIGRACHAQLIAVVGGVRADDVPHQQSPDHHRVGRPEAPPATRQEPAGATAVGQIEAVQCHQRDSRGEHSDDHREPLERTRRGREPTVQLGLQLQTGNVALQIAEHSDQLGPHVALAGDGVVTGQSDRCRGAVRGDRQRAVARSRWAQFRDRLLEQDRIAQRHLQLRRLAAGHLGDKTIAIGVGRSLGRGGQQQAAVGEISRGRTRDGRVDADRGVADERSLDIADGLALRPGQRRLLLFDRQQRYRDRQQDSHQCGNDRDEPCHANFSHRCPGPGR